MALSHPAVAGTPVLQQGAPLVAGRPLARCPVPSASLAAQYLNRNV